ncbi:hypothetical protein AMK15_01930 [Streptomyces sp. MJM1172]|nr:hypothetical protein AMK15_01930 [Streptomyces sp. MJM1172]
MNFVKANPARVYAVAVAAIALVAYFVPALPTELVLGLVAAVLGLGEAVQRTENAKTAKASAQAFAATYMCAKCPDNACADCPLVR